MAQPDENKESGLNEISIEKCPQNSKAYFEEDVKINGPRKVRVYFKLFSVENIDCVEGQVAVDFVFCRRWTDPCMINAMKDHGFARSYDEYEENCWKPNLEVNNDVSLAEVWDKEAYWNLRDETTGAMQFSQRYVVVTSCLHFLNTHPMHIIIGGVDVFQVQ